MTYKVFIVAIIGAAAAAAALSVFLDLPFDDKTTCTQNMVCPPLEVTAGPIIS